MLGYDRAARFTLHKPSATHASFQRSTCLPFCLPKTNSPTLDDIPLKASGYSTPVFRVLTASLLLAHHRVALLFTIAACRRQGSGRVYSSRFQLLDSLSRRELLSEQGESWAAIWRQHHRGRRAGFRQHRRRLPSAGAASSTMPSCASCLRPSATLTRPSLPSGAMLCVHSRQSASPTFPRRAPLDRKQLATRLQAAPLPHRHRIAFCRPERSIYHS